MVDRLCAFLDRPLDPSAARAILVFASAILVGLAALFVLGAGEHNRQTSTAPPTITSPSTLVTPAESTEGQRSEPRLPALRQDPQDVKHSVAGRRAARALRSHRALQHVPYRQSQLAVSLVGARGGRAILRVSAPTVRQARRGWHRFLRRYHDSGRAYAPVFVQRGGANG
jgi:hypothetical protein